MTAETEAERIAGLEAERDEMRDRWTAAMKLCAETDDRRAKAEAAHRAAGQYAEQITELTGRLERIRSAAGALRADLQDRAEWCDDAKQVCCGSSVWTRFCDALDGTPAQVVETEAERELIRRLASVEGERDRLRDALEGAVTTGQARSCRYCHRSTRYEPHAPDCLLSTPAVGGGWRPTIRHKKRGTSYAVEPTRATLQTDVPLGDNQELVIYRGEDGRRWARSPAEMEDGRFEPLPKEPDNG